jgi:glycosyltransferase involved in cell wall biosynthesis
MLISFVIPAFNAAQTIERTLTSVFVPTLPANWAVEALVVDDGSSDGEVLAEIVSRYAGARLLRHESNRGMCAGRNTGIAASKGDVVTILDADDEMVPDWPMTFAAILDEWPADVQLCYVACRNPEGTITATNPDYRGLLTLNDVLNERHSGEYLPMFRGEYVRRKPYVDLGMRKSCGIVSYISYALDGPFWVSPQVLRIYHDARPGSVTAAWTSPRKARETTECYAALFDRFEHLYEREAPTVRRTKHLRYAVYLRFAGLPGSWREWVSGASLTCIRESMGVALILSVGPGLGEWIAKIAKQKGLIRRYG